MLREWDRRVVAIEDTCKEVDIMINNVNTCLKRRNNVKVFVIEDFY